jgi:cell fate regulator YaaT (PSP1 superfamily)
MPDKRKERYLPRVWGSPKSKNDEPEECDKGPVTDDSPAERLMSATPSCSDIAENPPALEADYCDDVCCDPEDELTDVESESDDSEQWSDALELSAATPGTASAARIPVGIVGVRFGYACKIYHFECGDMNITAGDHVIVKTEKGMGLGLVATGPFIKEFEPAQLETLRKVLRKAEKSDFDQKERCEERQAEAYNYCIERIAALDLPMKLVSVECFFDGSKYVFYFTAEGRVDFRELVKQLVARFPVRIEMRQIGVRHEAKMTGGLGCCGQELCCSRYLVDFRPVSVKMAKTQNLSLNPSKISGVCGRLMCCLGYEHDVYEDFRKGLPRVGKAVTTSQGEGMVVKHNPLNETISVRISEDTVIDVSKDEIQKEPEPPAKKGRKDSGASRAQSHGKGQCKGCCREDNAG